MKMGRWRGRLYATDRARDFDHERVSRNIEHRLRSVDRTDKLLQDRNVRIRQIYETIDRQPYQWVVVMVAGIGFFLDGYTVCNQTMIPQKKSKLRQHSSLQATSPYP